MDKKHLVLSAVNLTEGGPLTVLRDCLSAAKAHLLPEWRITVLVHDPSLIETDGVEVRAFPDVKAKWSRRMLFEWWQLRRLSRELRADLWFSLHDITPVVTARRHVVYCHNPSPFYQLRSQDFLYSRTLVMMRIFYALLYGINIRRNDFVVVQQEWLRRAFEARYRISNVIVAYPNCDTDINTPIRQKAVDGITRFFYPALPRSFKNHDVLLAAASLLWHRGIRNFEINFTTTPEENGHISSLARRYKGLPCIRYLGRIPHQDVQSWYGRADALLFPSKLETWGLPISEAKVNRMPIICADLPYAYETVGSYDNVRFCAANSAEHWAEQMLSVIEGRWEPRQVFRAAPAEPFSDSWPILLQRLTQGL
jgi:glycosyltransferase involved in cell wall biosynthesis